jgi:predicted ATPase
MIDSITLKNFKCFEDDSIKLSKLNLLCGGNSVGKSSIIQSILLLKQNEDNILRSILLSELNKGMTYMSLNGPYIKLGSIKELLYTEAKDDIISISLKFKDHDISISNVDNSKEWSVSSNIPNGSIKLFQFKNLLKYISSNRITPENAYNLSEEDINKNNIGINGEFTAHLLAEKKHSEIPNISLKHPKSITNLLLENVSNWLSEISENIEINSRILPDVNQAILRFKYSYSQTQSNELTPQNVGFGLTHVLPIITSILTAKKNDVIIIENPEAQLHPKAQAKLAKLFCLAANQGTQLIIETHSDHILNSIRAETKDSTISSEKSKIYFFQKDLEKFKTKKTEIKINKDGSVDQWPSGFFDEWDNQLDRLLW